MTGTESLKNFMQNENVTQKDICDILNVPPSRVSEWCSFTRNCTSVVILDCWEDKAGKHFNFRIPVRGEVAGIVFDGLETVRDKKMYVGAGIWGIVKLWYFKNKYFSNNTNQ